MIRPIASRLPLNAWNRFAAAIVGGYIFAYGFVGLVTLVGFGLGLRFFEAADLARMLGFVVYLCVLLWAFSPAQAWKAWVWLAGGGAAMTGAAWGLSRTVMA